MRAASLVVIGAAALAGCSDGGAPVDDPGRVAAGVCAVLVEFDGEVADAVNAAAAEIHPPTDPDDARALLLDATDRVEESVRDLPDRYDELGLTDDGDVGELVADASDNTDAIQAEIDGLRDRLDGGLEGQDAMAILSHTFITMEKVQSLAQPQAPADLDNPLRRALDDEPDCEHTISR